MVIDDEDHDQKMNKMEPSEETRHSNVIAPFFIRMEHLYDFHDKFKRVENYKMNRSTMQYEIINLGSKKDPKNVNMGLGCTPTRRATFINFFK